ncbi:hypothetical protein ES708_26160 [subsurface metagenome]
MTGGISVVDVQPHVIARIVVVVVQITGLTVPVMFVEPSVIVLLRIVRFEKELERVLGKIVVCGSRTVAVAGVEEYPRRIEFTDFRHVCTVVVIGRIAIRILEHIRDNRRIGTVALNESVELFTTQCACQSIGNRFAASVVDAVSAGFAGT